ncbi:MAG: RNA polymerase sigma factor [Clostridia bacterium]|nr:RNA polymerase sigma factor [Clostridia bacterium]
MTDEQLIALYEERDEQAIALTEAHYGAYCNTIVRTMLDTKEDCEECLADVWVRVWNAIPPTHPRDFKAYVARVTRNTACDRLRAAYAQKRSRHRGCDALEEWEELVPSTCNVEQEAEWKDLFDRFLQSLSKQSRVIFVKRYWFMLPIERIASELDVKEDRVKTCLLRTRRKLKQFLEKEGVSI